MIKSLPLIGFIFLSAVASAQTIDEAKKFVYYERWNSAEDAFKKIISSDPTQTDAYYYLGELYMNEKKDEAANKVMQQGMDVATKNNFSPKQHPLIYIGWAHSMLNQGKTEEATKEFDDLLSMSKSKDAVILMNIARAYVQSDKGDADKAIDLLEKAAKRDKSNPEIYSLTGDAYRKKLDGSNAFKYYNKAIEASSSFAEAHHKLGEIFKTQKNEDLYLEEFTKATNADKNYAPSLLELYNYYFYKGNFDQAGDYLNRYVQNTDPSVDADYMKADLFYVTKKYPEAIAKAKKIIDVQHNEAKPRLYKMIAYCYDEQGDSAQALQYINNYFTKEDQKNYVIKDYDLRASLLERNGMKEQSLPLYQKAFDMAENDEQKDRYMRKIALLYKTDKDYANEAAWREKIYKNGKSPNNVDLFNWGVSLYFAGEYPQSDTVFSIYTQKYPEQLFGYLWEARCNAAIDTSMELGLAVPHYEKLIEVAEKNKDANRQTLISAYNYLGGYEANIKKDYEKSLEYFNKVLEVDQDNAGAQHFTEVLKKWIEQEKDDTKSTTTGTNTDKP